jgi:hypothetical protein
VPSSKYSLICRGFGGGSPRVPLGGGEREGPSLLAFAKQHKSKAYEGETSSRKYWPMLRRELFKQHDRMCRRWQGGDLIAYAF